MPTDRETAHGSGMTLKQFTGIQTAVLSKVTSTPSPPPLESQLFRAPEAYGAIGNGVADDTAALQRAVDDCCARGLVLVNSPGRIYRTTDTVQIGTGRSFASLRWVGQLGPDASAGVGYIFATNKAKPAINIQGARGVLLDGLTVIGELTNQVNAAATKRDKSLYTLGFSDTRWRPHVGISIDAFSGNPPAELRYPVAFGQWSSLGVTIRNCTIHGFVVGFCNFATPGNGESIVLDHCHVNFCATPYAVCQTQCRSNELRSCQSDAFHTALDCRSYGAGNGSVPQVYGGEWVRGYRLFNVATNFMPLRCDGLYAEAISSLGRVGGPLPAYFSGCDFVLEPIASAPERSNVHGVMGCPAVNFTACGFSTEHAMLNFLGTSGVIGAEITFDACDWVCPPDVLADYLVCKRIGGQRVTVRGGPIGRNGVVAGAMTPVAASGFVWSGDSVTFTAAGLNVGQRLLWKVATNGTPDLDLPSISETLGSVPALRVTVVSGTTVTARAIVRVDELDKAFIPTQVYGRP